jgi:hypothetical protein
MAAKIPETNKPFNVDGFKNGIKPKIKNIAERVSDENLTCT